MAKKKKITNRSKVYKAVIKTKTEVNHITKRK